MFANLLFGLFWIIICGIIASPFYYWYYVVTRRKEKREMAAHKITYEIEQAKKEERVKEEQARIVRRIKEEQEKNLQHLLTYGFPITGPESFKQAVQRVLQELKTKAPHRYAEAVTRLPKAEYVTGDRGFSGRSDGLFTIDGSGENNGQLNTYERFRFVFLHEVGHNVAYKENNDHSEEAANRYANMVQRELGL